MTVAFTICIIMTMILAVMLVFNGAVCLERGDRPTAYALFAQVVVHAVALVLLPFYPWVTTYAFFQTLIMFFFLYRKFKNQESA